MVADWDSADLSRVFEPQFAAQVVRQGARSATILQPGGARFFPVGSFLLNLLRQAVHFLGHLIVQ